MKSDKKAERYYEESRVYPIKLTDLYYFFCVQGDTGLWNVRFDLNKGNWECDCKNVRNTPCSHIKAAIKYMSD